MVTEYQFLSKDYDSNEIYLQATDKNRTQESGLGQMAGLYPNNTQAVHDWISPGPTPTGFNMTWVGKTENFINRLSEDSCPLFNKTHLFVKGSKAWEEAREYYYTQYR